MKKMSNHLGVYIAIGTGGGVGFGALMGNIGAGISIGLFIGIAFAFAKKKVCERHETYMLRQMERAIRAAPLVFFSRREEDSKPIRGSQS